jgi:hypothetical protein
MAPCQYSRQSEHTSAYHERPTHRQPPLPSAMSRWTCARTAWSIIGSPSDSASLELPLRCTSNGWLLGRYTRMAGRMRCRRSWAGQRLKVERSKSRRRKCIQEKEDNRQIQANREACRTRRARPHSSNIVCRDQGDRVADRLLRREVQHRQRLDTRTCNPRGSQAARSILRRTRTMVCRPRSRPMACRPRTLPTCIRRV